MQVMAQGAKAEPEHKKMPNGSDPFQSYIMGGVKTCRKIMRDEWEYETPDRCKWPAKGKILNRAENKEAIQTRFKRVQKYDNFFEYTSGYEVDRQHREIKSNVLDYLKDYDREEFVVGEDGVARLMKNTAVEKVAAELETEGSEDSLSKINDISKQLRLYE